MHKTVQISIADLLLDPRNPRLGEEQQSQQAIYFALATNYANDILTMAAHIVNYGLDPLNLPAVVPFAGPRKRYIVIEGNRRVLALKTLETPSIIAPALSKPHQRRFDELSARYAESPIQKILCVLFDNEEEAYRWVQLRHTGANSGAGLVEWNSNEKDRFRARIGGNGPRSAAGQIIDFVNRVDRKQSDISQNIISNINRLVNTPDVRRRLGIDRVKGHVVSYYPVDEIIKGLRKVVEDFRSGEKKVNDIYYEGDRKNYLDTFQGFELPDDQRRLAEPVKLDELAMPTPPAVPAGADPGPIAPGTPIATGSTSGATGLPSPGSTSPVGTGGAPPAAGGGSAASTSGGAPGQSGAGGSPAPGAPASGARLASRPRDVVVPKTLRLNINDPRIKAIFVELQHLEVDRFSNACSVLLRVLVELSVDAYIAQHSLMTDSERMNAKLAKKLKDVSGHLYGQQKIDIQLDRAVGRIADNQMVISASTITLNQYVHNRFTFPKGVDLKTAWDELQPFIAAIWA